MDDPFREVGVDADAQRARGADDLEFELAVDAEAAAGLCGAAGDGVRVGCPALVACFVACCCDQCVDRPCELVGVSVDEFERVVVLGRCSLAAERELGFGEDAREWCAQFV